MPERLIFRRVTGEEEIREVSSYGDTVTAGRYLRGRIVRFDDGLELRQHRPVTGPARETGYERLDNEILAGRRLSEVADWNYYPVQLARLYGDEATSAETFTLFEPYPGIPLREAGRYLGDDEFEAFTVSLLTGLGWIAAAGIAHQMISPDTVLWDPQRGDVLITDFSRSRIFGLPRTARTGSAGWVPPELRPGRCSGTVGPRDDVWAAGRLIFFARNQGEELSHRGQLADLDLIFSGLFDRVFGPPDRRPTARELLEHGLRRPASAPDAAERGHRLMSDRQRFLDVRTRKHPGVTTPLNFNADLDWAGAPAGQPTTPVNGDRPSPPDPGVGTSGRPGEPAKGRRFPRRRGDQ